jgi:DNA-binding CsgD family transcriptional regulator
VSEREWLVAQQVCTDRQLHVLRLYRQGMPKRAIARLLQIGPATVRDHLDAAARRIERSFEDTAA